MLKLFHGQILTILGLYTCSLPMKPVVPIVKGNLALDDGEWPQREAAAIEKQGTPLRAGEA